MNVNDLIKRHEGIKLKPYEDTARKLTIGVGRNLTDNGITEDECELMLNHDIQNAWDECAKYPWFIGLSEARKAACIDLMFNIGSTSFRGFTKFISAMAAANFDNAAAELFDSNWHREVGRRALEIEALILKEQWPI